MEHTKGPLKFGGVHSWEIFASSDGVVICTIHAAEPWQDGLLDVKHERTIAKTNAQRLVACWNGCEGINPEAVRELNARLQEITLAAKFDCPKTDAWSALLKTCEQTIAKAAGK